MDVELQPWKTETADGSETTTAAPAPPTEQVKVDQANGRTSRSDEHSPMLPRHHPGSNGDAVIAVRRDVSPEYCKEKAFCEMRRLKTFLKEKVFWRCRVWMIILFIITFIPAVIFISIVLCLVLRADPDDTFDSSSFVIPRNFSGSFRLTNQVLDASSNQSQVLASQLQEKLSGLYSDSPALARYFSSAEIHEIRNNSTEAVFSLRFLLPPKDQEQLQRFTLSRELVYNVLRQFLYDQEADPLQVDPKSLQMT